MIPGNFKTRPLIKIVPVFFLGIVVGDYFAGAVQFWLSAAVILFLAVIVLTEVSKSLILNSMMVYLLILFSGLMFGSHNKNQYKSDFLYTSSFVEPEVEFTSVIIDENAGGAGKWRLLSRLESIRIGDAVYEINRKIWFEPGEKDSGLNYGDLISGSGRLRQIPRARNPGEFDPAIYAFRQNIYVVIESESKDFRVSGMRESLLMRGIILPLRVRIFESIDRYIGGEEGEILKALTIGARSGFSKSLEWNLSRSGLWHLVSLSGMHLGIMTGFIFMLVIALRVPGRYRWGIVILFILFFCILAETRAPLIRAAVILTVIFGSRYIRRYTDPWNLLAFSALVIVLFRPGELSGAGFQLSYAAAGFIMAGANRLEIVIRKFRRSYMRNAIALLGVSFAATMGTAPLLAYHFGGIPFASIIGSLIGVPLTGLILLLFPIFIIVSCISEITAYLMGNSLWFCLRALIEAVNSSADLNLYINTPGFTGWQVILVFIPSVLFIIGKRQWLWTALMSANIFVWMSILEPPVCTVTFLDVGQGNAAVVETPSGQFWLIDAGMRWGNRNSGDDTILPFFQKRGISEIEYLFLSHNDIDHTGGVDAVVSRIKVSNAIVGEGSIFPYTFLMLEKRAGEWMKKSGLLLAFYNPGHSSNDDNDESLVFGLNYGDSSVLFTGDISQRKEAELSVYSDLMKSDILQVPHHGSAYSSSMGFLEWVNPIYAAISCGKDNFFGHPSMETLTRLGEAGANISRTDRDGAIVFELHPNKIRQVCWRKKF